MRHEIEQTYTINQLCISTRHLIIIIGAIFHIIQDATTYTEIFRMDRAIQDIVTYEDSLCVLTSGGVLTVFRKNKINNDGRVIELLNTVRCRALMQNIK